jgi:uncharacterized protein Yka (UPF0111/DUF47 family)
MKKVELQMELVKDLENNISRMKEECDKIKRNIEKNGVSGNFSINTIVYEIAASIYRDCSMLGYIKNFNLQIGDENERS